LREIRGECGLESLFATAGLRRGIAHNFFDGSIGESFGKPRQRSSNRIGRPSGRGSAGRLISAKRRRPTQRRLFNPQFPQNRRQFIELIEFALLVESLW
jgi:hypothetical protein